ncbi:MAG: hypothetical protein ACJAZ8_002609, partial [Planctomycetota bacterium]
MVNRGGGVPRGIWGKRGRFALALRLALSLRSAFDVLGFDFGLAWLGRFAWVGMLGVRRLGQQQDSGTR